MYKIGLISAECLQFLMSFSFKKYMMILPQISTLMQCGIKKIRFYDYA